MSKAIIIEAAFNMLKPVLDPIPGAAHSVTEFYDRITGAALPGPTPPVAVPSVRDEVFLTVKETATLLHLTTKSIHNMVIDGRLQHFRCGKVIRIPGGQLRELIGRKAGAR